MRALPLRLSLGLLCFGLTLPGEAIAARKAAPVRLNPAVAKIATKTPIKAQTKTTAKMPTERVAKGETPLPPSAPQTAWTAAESANCGRVRRKLWQADEGWIVKTVTVCH